MVSEPTLVGPKSMASAEKYDILQEMLKVITEARQTSEEMLKVITEARQTSERLSESWAKGLANPIEPHTTHLSSPITVMIPEKTANNYDPFIEPLGRASVLQVPGSVSDVFLVHRVDSYVKEVEELPQESTNSNEKNVAHQVFDKMPLAVTSKEKQRKSLKAWKFKFKISFKRSKLMDDMFSFVEETAWLNRDPKGTIWDCVKKEFKETMAACGKKTIDRLKLVDEISKPSVYDGPIQIRVWESGGSAFERVDAESSGDVKFHLKHKWRSRVLQTLSGWEFCLLPAKFGLRDWPKEESKPHQRKSHQIETFEVLSSLEPSRRSHNEQLGVSDDFPFAIVRTHISQSQSDLKCVTGNAHRMFDVMPLETKPLKNKRKKALQKTWWFKFKTSLERRTLMDAKFSFMEELGAQQGFNMEVWSGFDLEACIGFVTYGWEYKKQINIGHVSLNGVCNELVYDEEKKELRNVKPARCLCDLDQVNSLYEEEFVGFTEFNKLQLAMEFLLMNFGIFMHPQPRHDKRITRALLVGLVGNEERLSDRLSLANYVWKPGELLGVQDQWDWISEVHSGGGVMKITQRLRGMCLQGIIFMDMKVQEVIVDDVLSVIVCLSFHNKTFEAELEIYISYRCLVIKKFSWFKKLHVMSLQENSEMVLSLAKETQDWIVNSWLKTQVSSGFDLKARIGLEIYSWKYKKQHKLEKSPFQRTYATQLRRCGETARQICFFTDQISKSRVLAKQMLVKENDIELDNVETGEFFSSAHGGATVPQREMKLQQASEELLESPLLQEEKSIDSTKQIIIWIIFKELCSAGYAWENETIKESFKELSKHEKDHKLLFPKNQKLLNPEAKFCTQYNDLEQLNTEHQSSPGLDYFTYLNFIWKQVFNCGCEAGHISYGFSSVGDVHEFFICSKFRNGDETYGKRLLGLNEISLLDNDNKVDFTIKANWFYNKPMIREVFHLQRPPELIYLQGNPNFITKVLVQWKEHPPDKFFSGFYGQVLMLSSLRTRMF